MSAPDQKSMRTCIKDLKKNNVKILIKACETSYTKEQLTREDIEVQELIFDDGKLPTQEVMDRWLKIVDNFFDPKGVPQGQQPPQT